MKKSYCVPTYGVNDTAFLTFSDTARNPNDRLSKLALREDTRTVDLFEKRLSETPMHKAYPHSKSDFRSIFLLRTARRRQGLKKLGTNRAICPKFLQKQGCFFRKVGNFLIYLPRRARLSRDIEFI